MEIGLTGGEFRRLMELQFAPIRADYGLKMVEIHVLYFLAVHRNINTPTEIYRQLKLNRGHVSQAVESLCRRSYLTPIPDANDHRSVHYETTRQAQPVIERIDAIRCSLDRAVFAGLTRQELEAFTAISRKIRRNLARLLQESTE